MATVTKPIVLDETAKIIVEKLDAINSTLNKEEPSYHNLTEKPQINGVTLDGDKTWGDLDPQGILATKDYVEQEIGKFDIIKIVQQLPEVGVENRTYFVPKDSTDTEDLYDEYMWVGGRWELIGTKKMDIDLTNYIAKTDLGIEGNGQISWAAVQGKPTLKYPTAQQYGIDDRKDQGSQYSGTIDATIINAAVKAALSDKNRIGYRNGSKVTTPSLVYPAGLTDEEQANAREIIGAVGDTELDTKLSNYVSLVDGKVPSDKLPTGDSNTFGIVKIGPSNRGIVVANDGIRLLEASNTYIDNRAGYSQNPITPINLDYAVKAALTDSKKITYTDEEKTSARETIGAITLDDIPHNTPDTWGTFKIYGGSANYGLATHANGVFVASAEESVIDKRGVRFAPGDYKPTVPNTFDYTLKKALSAPVADTEHADKSAFIENGTQTNIYVNAWSTDEQQRARERIGAVAIGDILDNNNKILRSKLPIANNFEYGSVISAYAGMITTYLGQNGFEGYGVNLTNFPGVINTYWTKDNIILSDEIKKAAQNKLGLSEVNKQGQIGLVQWANEADIRTYRKTSWAGYRYVGLNQIDSAVKCALTDNQSLTYTSEEQQKVKEKFGITDGITETRVNELIDAKIQELGTAEEGEY